MDLVGCLMWGFFGLIFLAHEHPWVLLIVGAILGAWLMYLGG